MQSMCVLNYDLLRQGCSVDRHRKYLVKATINCYNQNYMNDLNVGPVLSNSDQWLIIPIENYITFDIPGRCFIVRVISDCMHRI